MIRPLISTSASLCLAILCLAGCDDPPTAVRTPEALPELPGTWTASAPMPTGRTELSATVLDDVVYLAGGATDTEQELPTQILTYDPARDAWGEAGHLRRGIRSPAMAAIADRVFVMGGFPAPPADATSEVQVLDPATGEVVRGPDMPHPAGRMAAAVLEGRIHVLGGVVPLWEWLDYQPLTDHRVFDPLTQQWTLRGPIPSSGEATGAAVVAGVLYLVVGSGLYRYEEASDSWSEASSAILGTGYGRTVAALDGRIYLIGGMNWPQILAFDPDADRWEGQAPMPTARSGHAVAVIGDALHVIAGWAIGGANWSTVSANERFAPR